MPFQFQQFSDYGTANPILARVFFQWIDILKFHHLPKERFEAVLGILHNDVVPRLVECQRTAESLRSDVEKGIAKGIKPQGKALGIPSVLRLESRIEDFVLKAQMALRDYSGIFGPLLGRGIPKGNVGVILKWAEKEFGKDDTLTLNLRTDHDGWIQYLNDLRVVITHPESTKGPLEIKNFTTDGAGILLPPIWELKGKHPASIVMEMDAFNSNLLIFCEMTLYYALWHLPLTPPCQFIEIPESKRNPANPIRFRMGL